MNIELKQRIEQINAGTAPAGYKKTKVGIVPEEWEVTRFASTSQKTGSERNDSDCAYPVYSINNKTGFAPQGDQFENDGYSNTSKDLYRIVRKGEFAYNPARINVGSIGLLSDVDAVIISSLYVCFKLNDKCYTPYFWQYFKSHRFNFDVNNYTEGSVREYLFYDNFARIRVAVPPLPEQQKIAEILTAQDEVIALLQRQIDLLKQQKKGFLQKMFPAKGNKVPEIRFKEFSGDWERRKVDDLLDLLTDYDANGSFADMAKNVTTYDGTGYAWYVRMTDLVNQSPLSEMKYVDESSYRFLKKTELHGGELLMAKRGEIGNVFLFKARTERATLAPNMYLLKLNNLVLPEFVYGFFQSDVGKKKLIRLNASTTMGALYKNDVKNIIIMLPCLKEQKRISAFFEIIDNLIALHQRKLEQEQQKKKALMQLLLTGKVRVKT